MKDILTTLRLVVFSIVVCCVLYTVALLAFARVVAPDQAAGSLLRDAKGTIIGSAQIAQAFTQPKYFWPRPSAADYDAAAASGSNLSPANPLVADRARDIIARYTLESGQTIPADLVTTSGSGLDPHITLAAARFQAPRVAKSRGLTVDAVQRQIDACRESTILITFGGEPVVNVLLLNHRLDNTPGTGGQ